MKKRPIELVLEMLSLLVDVSEMMDFQSFNLYCCTLDSGLTLSERPQRAAQTGQQRKRYNKLTAAHIATAPRCGLL